MGKQRRRKQNRDQAARERLFREKGVQTVNQPQPGEVVVTQTDMLAQIGALTLENTVLKNQLGQAAARIAQLEAQVAPETVAKDISAGTPEEPRLSVVERGEPANEAPDAG